MAENPMLKFTTIERAMPEKRDAMVRREDFGEILRRVRRREGGRSSPRAVRNCGVPYCSRIARFTTTSPTGSCSPPRAPPPGSLRAQPGGRTRFPRSAAGSARRNRLCEGNCVIEQAGHGNGHHRVGRRNTSPTPPGRRAGSRRSAPMPSARNRSGIIGAGPGGGWRRRTCCARAGVQVTVYEPLRPRWRADDLRHSRLQAGKGRGDEAHRPARGRRRGKSRAEIANVGDDISFDAIRASTLTRCWIATGVYKSRGIAGRRASAPRASVPRHRLPRRLEPEGLRRRCAGVSTRGFSMPREKRVVVDRRRRHGDWTASAPRSARARKA